MVAGAGEGQSLVKQRRKQCHQQTSFIFPQRFSVLFCFLFLTCRPRTLPTRTGRRQIFWPCSFLSFLPLCWTAATGYFSSGERRLQERTAVFAPLPSARNAHQHRSAGEGDAPFCSGGVHCTQRKAERVRRGKLRDECIALERRESLRTVGTPASWNYSRKCICIFRTT